MTRVLALDIATTSGAAFDGPEGVPAFSTHKGKVHTPGDFGAMATGFRGWINDLITVQTPDHLVFEAPWFASGPSSTSRFTSPDVVTILVGLAFLAEQIAHERAVPCSKVAVSTVRKHFLGSARVEKPKQAVLERCRLLGWRPKNDHEGDAGALYSYAKSLLDPTWSPRSTPLYGRQA